MEHFKRLTSQQLVMAACGALVAGSVMLSHGSRWGFLCLGLALACGIGAFLKAGRR